MKNRSLPCVSALAVLLAGSCTRSPRPEEPALSLLSASSWAEPGTEFLIGVRIRVPDGWHTYWRNPGEVGEPAQFEWKTPSGVTIAPLPWPVPEIIVYDGLVSYGYRNEVILPFRLSVAAGADPVERIACRVRWMICRDVCLPVEGEAVWLFSAAKTESAAARKDALLLENVLRLLPQKNEGWQFDAVWRDGAARIRAVPPADMPPAWQEQAIFLPAAPGLFGYRGSEAWHREADGRAVFKDLPLSPGIKPASDHLDGLLVFRKIPAHAILVQATIAADGSAPASGSIPPQSAPSNVE